MRHGFYDELSRQDIRHILVRHEQGAIHAADGEEIAVSTETESVRFLLMAGKPIREPVAWYGPIVMNTQEELRIAFEEYEKGAFIKHKKA